MRYSLALLALVLAACSGGDDAASTNARQSASPTAGAAAGGDSASATAPPTVTAAPVTTTLATAPADWPAAFEPAAGSLCPRVATRAVTIRMRPSADAAQFGQLAVGEHVSLAARTADGWVGFDPHTAQAANVGIFRLRWVRVAEAFAPGDTCGNRLLLVAAPPAGCLIMATHPIPVRAQATADAKVLSTIPRGSYARVAQPPAGAAGNWVEVLLPDQKTHGFVAQADVNFNGPCQ